jgi:hypothetical protein
MGASLGADFGKVRVHTGAGAAAAADAVHARAYTVGNDIVFGPARFDPGSDAGRRLIAHELVHVAQQSEGVLAGPLELGAGDSNLEREAETLSASVMAGSTADGEGRISAPPASPALRRAPDPPAATLVVPPLICGPDQTRALIPAVSSAQRALEQADQALAQFLANPAAKAAAGAARALQRYFPPGDAATARYVQEKLRQIAQRLRTDPAASGTLKVECHTSPPDTECLSANAYVRSGQNLMVFCPNFFRESPGERMVTAIHEVAHSLLPRSDPLFITDRAYVWERKFRNLAPGEALTNAASYSILVQEIALGSPVATTAPTDPQHDCPPDWQPLLRSAAEEAQRWNLQALNEVSDRDPAAIAQHSQWYDALLGGHTVALLDAAATDYKNMSDALGEEIDFECEPSGGGRCDTAETYWYALFSHLHVCPRWRNLASPDDRTEGILTGMYGYKGIVDDRARWRKLAQLARKLHGTFKKPPTAAQLAGGLAAPGPGTPPAPPPGPPPPF